MVLPVKIFCTGLFFEKSGILLRLKKGLRCFVFSSTGIKETVPWYKTDGRIAQRTLENDGTE
jgi:hypothetical protein